MERQLQTALTLSLLMHAAVLWSVPAVRLPALPKRLPTEIKVTYDKRPESPQLTTTRTAGVSAPAQLPAPPPMPARSRTRPASIPDPALLDGGAVYAVSKPRPQLPESIDLSNLTQLSSDAVAYMDYFRFLRERIRWAALRNYPSRNVQGEVYLTFTLAADGRVADARIVEARSTPDPALRAASLESLRQAAPFPSFPKTLDRPQMTFRIVIVYEVGQPR